jgi:hypothetical protein
MDLSQNKYYELKNVGLYIVQLTFIKTALRNNPQIHSTLNIGR